MPIVLASEDYSLKFFPNPSKNKWAVLFGTRYGSNRDAAIWISEGMGAIADVFDAGRIQTFPHSTIWSSSLESMAEKLLSR